MALDTIPETMIHRPNPQVGFIHAERPFDEPKIMVVGKDFFIWKLCIGHISLDSVPCGVLLKSFKVDAYGRLALNTEVLVVATIVYVFFGDFAGGYFLLKPLKTFGPVERVFLPAFFRE